MPKAVAFSFSRVVFKHALGSRCAPEMSCAHTSLSTFSSQLLIKSLQGPKMRSSINYFVVTSQFFLAVRFLLVCRVRRFCGSRQPPKERQGQQIFFASHLSSTAPLKHIQCQKLIQKIDKCAVSKRKIKLKILVPLGGNSCTSLV